MYAAHRDPDRQTVHLQSAEFTTLQEPPLYHGEKHTPPVTTIKHNMVPICPGWHPDR